MRRSTADTGHLWGGGGGGGNTDPDISRVRSMDPEDCVITGFHCMYKFSDSKPYLIVDQQKTLVWYSLSLLFLVVSLHP